MTHVQCLLEKGTVRHQAWIPAEHAEIGKFVRLKDENFGWSDGWEVISVFDQTKLDSKWVAEHERDYLKQRGASDI